jgi:hypothetical protein
VFKLAGEHPLTKAGLRGVHLVETAELGLTLGDIVLTSHASLRGLGLL